MSQKAVEPIALCFNPTCPSPCNCFGLKICASCGADLQLQARYIAVKRLGQGGLGRTFLAIDSQPEPMVPCIIKQFWAENFSPNKIESFKPSFKLDVQRLIQLGTHTQIPTFLNSFEQEGFFYWVQEYIVGSNLAIELAERGPFSSVEIWAILNSLLPLLQYVHEHGVIHRDIKPENLLLQRHPIVSDALTLVDFSSAQLVTPTSTILQENPVGSPQYAAPEQLLGKATFASDLYSLGVTCLHLLTGIPPLNLFDLTNDRWAWRDYWLFDPTHGHHDLAEFLDQLIEPALSKRFASAEAAIAAMPKHWRHKISVTPSIPSPQWKCYATLSGHSGLFASVNAIAISSDSNTVVSASDDQTVRVWDIQTGNEVAVLQGHQKPVKAVVFHPHVQNLLATAGRDRIIQIWDITHHQSIRSLTGHHHPINALAFSPDGHTLASGSADKTINLWDFATSKIIHTLNGHTLPVKAITFSPTQPILVSASTDSTVKVWDLKQFELKHTLTKHTASVSAIAFNPSGKILTTGSEDRSICLWDVESWQLIRVLPGHSWPVSALTFSTDGATLFSASWDKTIKAWDISSGKEVTILMGHTDSVTCLAISQSGNIIASGSNNRTIKLWRFTI